MEATAGAAPSPGAGTGSVQSGSPSSQSKASNSAGQNPQPQRQSNAAPPSSKSEQRADAREPANTDKGGKSAPAGDDDPDFDFGERGKFKRSRVVNDFRRIHESQKAEAKARHEVEQRHTALTKQLKDLGLDPETLQKDPQGAAKAFAHALVQKQLEEATLDPLELAKRKAEAERDEQRARADAFEKTQQEEQERAAVETRAQDYAQQINAALEQADLPRNPKTIARMAEIMLAAAKRGSKLSHQELAKRVAEQVFSERDHHLSSFKGDGAAIAKWLGPENVAALHKHLAAQTTEEKFFPSNPTKPKRPAAPKGPKTSHPNGYWTLDQWNQWEAKQRSKR